MAKLQPTESDGSGFSTLSLINGGLGVFRVQLKSNMLIFNVFAVTQ